MYVTPRLPPPVVDFLPRFRQALGRPRNIIIIDASGDQPIAHVAYFRAWIEHGMRVVSFAGRNWRDVDQWLGENTKLLLVLQQGRDLIEPVKDLINQLPVASYELASVDPETGKLIRFLVPLP